MFSSFQFVLYLSVVGVIIYWSIGRKFVRVRAGVVIALSLTLFASVSIISLVWLIGIVALAFFMIHLQARYAVLRSIAFSLLVFLPLIVYSALQGANKYPIVIVGLSYYTLKLYSLIRDVANRPSKLDVTSVIFYIVFYPVFTVGPIENFNSLNSSKLAVDFDANEFLYGVFRVLLGFLKVSFVGIGLLTPLISEFDLSTAATLSVWTWTLLSFLYLYVNFSGISDIAIGLSRVFGVEIRENFNHPYLAKNIQEFWQRWHMSLGAYLYFPLVRANGKPLVSIVIVFVLIGAWHEFSFNYLIWGAAHGLAMAANSYLPKQLRQVDLYRRAQTSTAYLIFAGMLTILYVSIASRFANAPSFEAGIEYLGYLF